MKKQFLKIRTKNHTARPLKNLIEVNTRTVFRLGSITPAEEIFPRGVALNKPIIEINTAEACHNSGNKLLMKRCFYASNVKSAEYSILSEIENWGYFPAIIKHKNSCKGNGIYYINDNEELNAFISNHNVENYIIEKYYNYSREYRLHVTKDGCFYSCRKMLKNDAEVRWHRHDMNSVWILEENELFNKPSNWDNIINECIKALNSVGLDIGACDVKVQTEKNKPEGFIPEFIVLEINSAPSLGEITLIKYEEQLKKMIK